MAEQNKRNAETDNDEGQSVLKLALIIFAVIEALVLIPTVFHLIYR